MYTYMLYKKDFKDIFYHINYTPTPKEKEVDCFTCVLSISL